MDRLYNFFTTRSICECIIFYVPQIKIFYSILFNSDENMINLPTETERRKSRSPSPCHLLPHCIAVLVPVAQLIHLTEHIVGLKDLWAVVFRHTQDELYTLRGGLVSWIRRKQHSRQTRCSKTHFHVILQNSLHQKYNFGCLSTLSWRCRKVNLMLLPEICRPVPVLSTTLIITCR